VHAEDGRNIGFGKSIIAHAWENFPAVTEKNSATEEKSSASNAIINFLWHLSLSETSVPLPKRVKNFLSIYLRFKRRKTKTLEKIVLIFKNLAQGKVYAVPFILCGRSFGQCGNAR